MIHQLIRLLVIYPQNTKHQSTKICKCPGSLQLWYNNSFYE